MKKIIPLTLVMLMAVGVWTVVPMTSAQSPECWEETKVGEVTEYNALFGISVTSEVYEEDYNKECNTINDGRVNNHDRAAEAAIYCSAYGVEIYDLDWSGNGEFVFRSTWNEIDRVPQVPAENTMIEGAPGFALYRLTSGELQLNGPADWEGKPYVFIWNGCERPTSGN